MYKLFLKRTLDFILSIVLLILLSPLLFVLVILVYFKIGSPVIFTQDRPGKNEKVFQLYKFRTMTTQRDQNGVLLPDELRLTRFGELLRASSLDELPELFNILRGDMSFIGPRPLLVDYLPLYNKSQRRRHEVRPGLSGYAQISGRNLISWEERFNLDLEYIDNITFRNDFKIFVLTIKKILWREGISSETSKTMERFEGSNRKTGDKISY